MNHRPAARSAGWANTFELVEFLHDVLKVHANRHGNEDRDGSQRIQPG
jgi:hypothetical protein